MHANKKSCKKVKQKQFVLLLVVAIASYYICWIQTKKSTKINQSDIPIIDFLPAQKPFLILHVGPPKTATTTIQQQLTDMKAVLALDNYVYTGTFQSNEGTLWSGRLPVHMAFKNFSCHRQLSATRKRFANDSSFHVENIHQYVPCWNDALELLKSHGNASLIVSDETLSYNRWAKFFEIGKAPFDWVTIKETVRPHYEVIIVVAYRHYFEWLLSAKQQVERHKPSKHVLNAWPGRGGVALMPLFPDYWKAITPGSSAVIPYFYTNRVMERLKSSSLPIRVLNLHSNNSLMENFLCHVLPNARHMCLSIQQMEQQQSQQTQVRLNVGEEPPYYDMIVTTAAERGYLDADKISRRQAVEMVRWFHQTEELNTDLDLICPSTEDLQAFLNLSLQHEKSVFGTTSAQHEVAFWETAKLSKFCTVNVESVLQDSKWKEFFQTGIYSKG